MEFGYFHHCAICHIISTLRAATLDAIQATNFTLIAFQIAKIPFSVFTIITQITNMILVLKAFRHINLLLLSVASMVMALLCQRKTNFVPSSKSQTIKGVN